MLKIEDVLSFCVKNDFFTSKPNRACILNAMKLDPVFGAFIKKAMVSGTKFESAESFISAYKYFCIGDRLVC